MEVSDRIKQLGARIRDARTRRGWSMAELAEKAQINRNTLMWLERGKPSVAMGAYITVLWLLGLDGALDAVAHPDTDTHGKTLEIARRPKRIRKSKPPKDEYDF